MKQVMRDELTCAKFRVVVMGSCWLSRQKSWMASGIVYELPEPTVERKHRKDMLVP
jgi:hypothetical protein